MMRLSYREAHMRDRVAPRLAILVILAALAAVSAADLRAARPAGPPPLAVSVFADGLNNPRGMKFGPDGALYVAEAGTGGETPNAAACAGPFSYLAGFHSRISRIDGAGTRTTVIDNLPSAVDQFAGYWGASDVAFVGSTLYALEDAGGCERGHPEFPTSLVRIADNGTMTPVADLQAWIVGHPTAVIEPGDFEVDGSWWNLLSERGDLYTVNPNTGDFVKIATNGVITRVVDTSASLGHVVPTALASHGVFHIGNLGVFPIAPGSSQVWQVEPSGRFQVEGSSFTSVVGLAYDHATLYVLEASTIAGSFLGDPGEGALLRVRPGHGAEVLLSGIDFPSSVTVGPDGAVYVARNGIAPDANGTGQILRIAIQ
jgi:hypothetical protein